jgi:hypothetical protein
MRRYSLLAAALFLLSAKAMALSPDDAKRGFRNLNFCHLIFEKFDISKVKNKNIGIIVYNADEIKIKEMERLLIEQLGTMKFSKEDINKIYASGIFSAAMEFHTEADSYTQTDIANYAASCRKMLY